METGPEAVLPLPAKKIPVIISKKEKAAAIAACFKKLFVFSPFYSKTGQNKE